jgi:hypothetical protein
LNFLQKYGNMKMFGVWCLVFGVSFGWWLSWVLSLSKSGEISPVFFDHIAPCVLHPAPRALRPAPCATRFASCTLRHAPRALRHAPRALRPAPCALRLAFSHHPTFAIFVF